MSHHDDWESALDKIDWNDVLRDVDKKLLENLAAELRFKSYNVLEHASQPLGDGYYITHLSEGTWAFWNNSRYVEEDVQFFDTSQQFLHFALERFSIQGEEVESLVELLAQARQMKQCFHCGFHFDPEDPARKELGIDGIYLDEEEQHAECCSPQCAVEAMVQEWKEG
ncbi:hypothetical protein [Desmospora profundinema]|uniref:Deoxyxylulose-5-phosphate synthase n=1 Tax=Desmospora profundinema TaxID=1571184 RepID=A0ABU1IM67_9BACL|nr:hypothetical protein [Desmospora profundinema]MDR6225059.1 deoxyxylulose-5-phosphate synthase [Desmospora profundinema]